MKTIAKILLVAVALISTAATVSAQNVKASEYRKEGSVLELKNDRGQVMVAFDIEVGAHFIRPGQLCVITPMFVNGSYQEEFAPVMLEGKRYAYLARERAKFDKIYGPDYSEKIVYYGEPVSVHYQLVTPYTPELKGSTLVLNYKTYDFCGKEIAEQSTTLAHGVNDYADFIQDNPVVYYFPNPVYKTYVNDFNNRSIFRQGHTAIDEDVFRTNGYDDLVAEVKRIDEDGRDYRQSERRNLGLARRRARKQRVPR